MLGCLTYFCKKRVIAVLVGTKIVMRKGSMYRASGNPGDPSSGSNERTSWLNMLTVGMFAR